MTTTIETGNLKCLCGASTRKDKIAYILYPMDILGEWIENAVKKYNTTIVAVTGMDWEVVFSPWAAKGVPKGSPDFKGDSPEFLDLLRNIIIPSVETSLGIDKNAERSLVGVSMSGLFALWQWMLCDTFQNIASLSGSFWYEGFLNWMKSLSIPHKSGKGFFLLGDQEAKSKVKAFESVAINTQEIFDLLRSAGINIEFQSVPGNHYSDPIPRLDKAFTALFIESGPQIRQLS